MLLSESRIRQVSDLTRKPAQSTSHACTYRAKVFSTQQALDYVGSRVKITRKTVGQRRPFAEEAVEALSTIVLAHVPVDEGNFRPKCIYVATMARRVVLAMRNDKDVDDRDYVGNKRLEL
jgi:DNA-directed RNA polymerase III subunit RPC2